jgi:hypothetical protein
MCLTFIFRKKDNIFRKKKPQQPVSKPEPVRFWPTQEEDEESRPMRQVTKPVAHSNTPKLPAASDTSTTTPTPAYRSYSPPPRRNYTSSNNHYSGGGGYSYSGGGSSSCGGGDGGGGGGGGGDGGGGGC